MVGGEVQRSSEQLHQSTGQRIHLGEVVGEHVGHAGQRRWPRRGAEQVALVGTRDRVPGPAGRACVERLLDIRRRGVTERSGQGLAAERYVAVRVAGMRPGGGHSPGERQVEEPPGHAPHRCADVGVDAVSDDLEEPDGATDLVQGAGHLRCVAGEVDEREGVRRCGHDGSLHRSAEGSGFTIRPPNW